MRTFIQTQLWYLRGRTKYLSQSKRNYYSTMVDFFLDVKDPLDFDELSKSSWLNPYQPNIDRTAKLSGVNDRRTDRNGNDFWVEETSLFD